MAKGKNRRDRGHAAQEPGGRALPHHADPEAAAAAIRTFLEALGLDSSDPALASTPDTTARAFLDRLLDGYRTTPAAALGAGFPLKNPGPLVATNLPLMFVCPHHLMPARGVAHVGFVPRDRVPGLGRIAKLCDALAHRLVLQEELTEGIARALIDHLSAEAAVVIIEAQHLCVAIEDFARRDTTFRTRAAIGGKSAVASLESQIDASLVGEWPTSASKPSIARESSRSRSRSPRKSAATPAAPTSSRPRRRSRSDVS